MKKLVAALLISMTIALPVLAHQGGHTAYGVVKEITAVRLVVTDEHGKETVFALTPGTRFFRDHKAIGREKVMVGERAVVKGKDAGGQMEASTVDLGAAPKLAP
jgi:hypothetical protein